MLVLLAPRAFWRHVCSLPVILRRRWPLSNLKHHVQQYWYGDIGRRRARLLQTRFSRFGGGGCDGAYFA